MVGPQSEVEKRLLSLKQFFDSLGYRRIIVLRASSMGQFVFKDQEYRFHVSDKPSATQGSPETCADRVICCETNFNDIDIGVCGRTFTQSELELFFENEIHKELLVVKLGKSLHKREAELFPFVEKLGYSRVIYLPD